MPPLPPGQGQNPLADLHLHNQPGEEANKALAHRKMARTGGALVMGFSFMEEGLMVARGNPLNIRTAADLLDDPRIQIILDVLQSRGFRDELSLLPGYSQCKTGTTIAAF
jgi:molybdate-binding protein